MQKKKLTILWDDVERMKIHLQHLNMCTYKSHREVFVLLLSFLSHEKEGARSSEREGRKLGVGMQVG